MSGIKIVLCENLRGKLCIQWNYCEKIIRMKNETKAQKTEMSAEARACRKYFLGFFPKGFGDAKYFDWERGYKLAAHEHWQETLNKKAFRRLLDEKRFAEIAARALKIESKTNLLFSFEKMALRDAVRTDEGARVFAESLYEFLHGAGKDENKFARWTDALDSLPRRQTRVLNWTNATVFPFLAQPEKHIFFKPNTTRNAARGYGFDLAYNSRPSWEIYKNLLAFAETIRLDQSDLEPRDMIDLQSFIWVIGSEEYKHL